MICALVFVAGLVVGGCFGALMAGVAMAAKIEPPPFDEWRE